MRIPLTLRGVSVAAGLCACLGVSTAAQPSQAASVPALDSGAPFWQHGEGASSPSFESKVGPVQGVPISFWQLDPVLGSSGLSRPDRIVVTTDAQLRQIWLQIYSNVSPAPDLPSVDFSKEVVVVLAMGVQSTGGYAIRATNAIRTPTGVLILVEVQSPGANCGVTTSITTPVALLRMNRQNKPLEFRSRSVVRRCD